MTLAPPAPATSAARARDAAAVLRAALPAHVAVAAVPMAAQGMGRGGTLFPVEAATLGAARAGRRAEFAAGRAAARLALGLLGGPAAALPVGPGRAPVWPAGFRGSLTHADGLALAMAAPAARCAGLGLDAEPDVDLPADLASEVLTAQERRRFAAAGSGALRAARRAFCAKEAAFKALFPLCGLWAGFETAEMLALPPPTGTEGLRLLAAFGAQPAGTVLPVIFARAGGLMLAAVVLPPEQETAR